MRLTETIEKLRDHFPFLFEQYGYAVIGHQQFDNTENWIVVLRSPRCGRLLLMRDDGEIILALGPHGETQVATDVPWYDVAVVLEYLSGGQDMLFTGAGHPEHQLAQLAGALAPYMEQVAALFGSDAFETTRPLLDRIGARREREMRA